MVFVLKGLADPLSRARHIKIVGCLENAGSLFGLASSFKIKPLQQGIPL